MVDTIKFSQMTPGGDIAPGDFTPGLLDGANVLFSNSWTFLAPGSTASRPIPSPEIDGRLRFNTDNLIYEYYDTLSATWVELSGSGSGTVNPGIANAITFYAANGTAVSPTNSMNSAVLVTSASGFPSLSTTLPAGLSIPGAIITSSIASLISGQISTTPVNPTDLVNKAYVDSSGGGAVSSITGTTNQVIVSSPTGNVTLSTPQDIATGSTPTFAGLALTSIPLGSASGGTGINNGSNTLTLAGNMVTQGAFSLLGAFPTQFNITATTNVTFPTSGTLATTSQLPTGSALTEIDDTNVTLTLGGSPATALLNATSLTLGWTGTLSGTRGGTGVNNGSNTLTLGGSLTTSGAFASTFTMTGATNVTFPTSGTLATTAGTVTSVTGTANQIGSTGGTTPIISLASNPIVPGTGGIQIPGGTTAQRAGGAGTIRFNSQLTLFESTVDGTTWATISTSSAGVTSLTGTANQVIVSAPSGNVTLSAPQNIGTTSSPTFAGMTLTNPYIAGAGGLHSFQILTSGTAATYTKPANVKSILVEIWGGGGGGGGGTAAVAQSCTSGGGGAGGHARLYVPTAAATYTYTIGLGGTAGSASPGGTGGTSSFSASSLQATGGAGGNQGTSVATTLVFPTNGGNGGNGVNGDVNNQGSYGLTGLTLLQNNLSGGGGSSTVGSGGMPSNTIGSGASGSGFASGGAGSISSNASNFNGGAGSPGLIIVWEFA